MITDDHRSGPPTVYGPLATVLRLPFAVLHADFSRKRRAVALCVGGGLLLSALSLPAQVITTVGTNVGIGTAGTPAARLEVSGSAFVTGRTMPSAGAGLEAFYASGQSFLLSYDRTGAAYKSMGFDGSDLEFYINGSEKFRLASNGNVGIGTAAPGYPLAVSSAAVGAEAIPLYVRNETTWAPGVKTSIGLGANNANQVIGKISNVYDTNFRSYLAFGAWNNGFQENLMIVRGDGNVGIGTTTPASPFTLQTPTFISALISGTGSYGAGLHLESQASGVRYQLQAMGTATAGRVGNFEIQNYNTGAVPLTITNAGNVGIGTASPTGKLVVATNASADNAFILASTRAFSGNRNWRISLDQNVEGMIEITPSTALGGNAYTNTALAISNAGNVGIGTTSPSIAGGYTPKLHLAGAYGAIALESTTAAKKWGVGVDSNGALDIFESTSGYGGRLLITNSGNVGIGTSSPLSKLHVQGIGRFGLNDAGNNNIGGILVASGTGVGGARQYWIGASNPTSQNNNMFQISDYNGSTNYPLLTIYGMHAGPAGGNVGIGTTAPTQKLQFGLNSFIGLPGGSGPYVPVAWQRGYSGIILAGSSSTDGASGWAHGSRLVSIDYGDGLNAEFDTVNASAWTNSALVISSRNGRQGNVGIGTGSPDFKLHVAGSVRATSFIADANTYADFVFQPGYRLAPLGEVEAAIKEQGHLPDIPSETEARRDGIDVARMQAKLLQKVEELTLHLIAQEKRMESIEKENAALRQQVGELKADPANPRSTVASIE